MEKNEIIYGNPPEGRTFVDINKALKDPWRVLKKRNPDDGFSISPGKYEKYITELLLHPFGAEAFQDVLTLINDKHVCIYDSEGEEDSHAKIIQDLVVLLRRKGFDDKYMLYFFLTQSL